MHRDSGDSVETGDLINHQGHNYHDTQLSFRSTNRIPVTKTLAVAIDSRKPHEAVFALTEHLQHIDSLNILFSRIHHDQCASFVLLESMH